MKFEEIPNGWKKGRTSGTNSFNKEKYICPICKIFESNKGNLSKHMVKCVLM